MEDGRWERGEGSKRKDARPPALADGRFSSDQAIFSISMLFKCPHYIVEIGLQFD